MKVTFIKEFTYWHGGYEAKVYGPGEVDVPDEVAETALACGVLAEEQAETTTTKKTKGKK